MILVYDSCSLLAYHIIFLSHFITVAYNEDTPTTNIYNIMNIKVKITNGKNIDVTVGYLNKLVLWVPRNSCFITTISFSDLLLASFSIIIKNIYIGT